MTDEDVIKRRLLIDGDGTGDERRLNNLHKSISKLCQSQETESELRDSLDRILNQLSQCKFSVNKSRKVAEMNKFELGNYKKLSQKITLDITQEKKKIEKTKVNLIEAKRVRKNKMEYDILGKVIAKQPDRKHSEKQLQSLQSELENLRTIRLDIVKRLSYRRRQFHGLVLLLHQLQSSLSDDDQQPIADTAADEEQVMDIETVSDDIIVL